MMQHGQIASHTMFFYFQCLPTVNLEKGLFPGEFHREATRKFRVGTSEILQVSLFSWLSNKLIDVINQKH